ncbi:hypothetical protein QYM36_016286 [Artemia franciscana]|uniref:Dynein axonemal assembly factor 1 homolog n=2 Tax=Artemia franciscana TaxID=6661 RepID=A0AA88H6N7_ARTSF|nr:hypothetical protein QYM36_016286 [Artemia franciscana]
MVSPLAYDLAGVDIQHAEKFCYLGVLLDSKLLWTNHIDYLVGNLRSRANFVNAICLSKRGAPYSCVSKLIGATITSKLDYGSMFYREATKHNLQKLDSAFNQVLRRALGCLKTTPTPALYCELGVTSLQRRRNNLQARYFLKKMGSTNHIVYKECIATWNQDLQFRPRFSPTVYKYSCLMSNAGLPGLQILLILRKSALSSKMPVEIASSDEEHTPDAQQNEGETNELVILDPEAEDVDLNHGRIAKIENLEALQSVKTLSLRWNFIKKIENLSTLTTLKELELYDNQITKIEGLESLVNLEVLDISHNRLSKIENLEGLTKLKKLFLCSNRISKIENLGHLRQLEYLELGDNRIKVIENLEGLGNLTSLFLGKNKISKIENLDAVRSLKVLSLQSNRLLKIGGLEKLTSLEDLYVSHNGIEKIEGLENNLALTTLDLSGNRISKIENVKHLTKLTDFWFNDNCLQDWSCLEELSEAKELDTVYFERNPIQKDPNYRRKIKLILQSVNQIDATLCH